MMYSPFRLLVLLTVAVCSVELSIMVLFSWLPPMPPLVTDLLDAFLLALVLFPILYFLMFRPLRLLAKKQARMARDIEAANTLLQHDVAELERFEEALDRSEMKFQTLFESASDCILILDLEGNIRDINHTGYERLGYTKEEMLGKSISVFDPPEFALSVAERLEIIRRKGHAVFESAHVRKDGTVMPVEINTRTVELNGQQRILSIVRDITERKQVKAALLQSEANLRAMLDNLPFLTWLKDTDGRFISVNKVFADYVGLDDPQQLVGKTDVDLQPPELAEKYRADDAEVMVTRKQKHTLRESFDGNRIHWVEAFKTPIIDSKGTLLGTVGFARDITERQRMEQQLNDMLLFNQTILDKSPYGIAVFSADGPCVMANEAYARYVGGTIEQVLTQNFRSIVSWQQTGMIGLALKALESGQDIKGDFEGTTTFGKQVFFEFTFSSIVIQGRPHLMLMMNDIMDRVLLQQSLVSSMHQIEEKELAKTRFLAAAGHDLRQPLAAANLFVGALKLTEQTPEQEAIIQRLDQSITTFKDMLDALLNVSKLEAGVVKPEYTSIDVAELFGWLNQNFELPALEKRLQLRLSFPLGERLLVRSDVGLVQSVLMNLVSNAIKFTGRGGVLVSARRRGRDVLFQVWDTGMGIEEEYLPKIFEEFYQVHNPQRDRTKGLGLGLSIAKRALSLLGGEITCRSQSGRGTVFEFSLPRDEQAGGFAQPIRVPDAKRQEEQQMFARDKRFVLVEDDELVAHATVSLLQTMGGEVTRFCRPEEALLHPRLGQADYFIVDYMLGGSLSGIQLLNLLRQKLGRPIKAVLVTGDTSSGFMREAAACDWTVLHKPVNISRLIDSLKAQER